MDSSGYSDCRVILTPLGQNERRKRGCGLGPNQQPRSSPCQMPNDRACFMHALSQSNILSPGHSSRKTLDKGRDWCRSSPITKLSISFGSVSYIIILRQLENAREHLSQLSL